MTNTVRGAMPRVEKNTQVRLGIGGKRTGSPGQAGTHGLILPFALYNFAFCLLP